MPEDKSKREPERSQQVDGVGSGADATKESQHDCRSYKCLLPKILLFMHIYFRCRQKKPVQDATNLLCIFFKN